MAKNNIIEVLCFGEVVGVVGLDENRNKSFFQYDPSFLRKNINLFPKTGILKRVAQTQVFSKYNNETFRGLPPQIADSLPDMFGNIIFKTWLEASQKSFNQITVIEQLAYVGNRGMGALEYRPSKSIPENTSINIDEIVTLLNKVIYNKRNTNFDQLNSEALVNIFKIGTSAGGARPKILISENKATGHIMPGDLEYSNDFNHYLVKLAIDEELGYNRELIEYCYYLTAIHLNIRMMPSKMIDNIHFATLRFDRQNGEKQHILTATGMTGWDFKNPLNSSYENLFDLASFLNLKYQEREELFKRMIFNIVFCNMDDHLKNHSFIYDKANDQWQLSPAYDLTYSLNPLLDYQRISRALSINQKRVDINLEDVLKIADLYSIKNPKGIITEVEEAIPFWIDQAKGLKIAEKIINSIKNQFLKLL